jgi:ribosome-associated protein
MMMVSFRIKGEYIELIQLLKVVGIAESGGHAKAIVENGEVKVNGVVEERKRAKLKTGDKVEFNGEEFVME